MADSNHFSPQFISPGPELPLDSDAAFGVTLECITDAVFALDRQWRFVYLNAAAEVMLQRPRAELLGTDLWAAFPEAAKSIFDEQYHQVMATRIAATFEAFYAPLGLWVETRAYPSPVGITVFCRDVTERIRAKEAWRESESRFRLLAEHAKDIIFRFRFLPTPGFEYVSPSATAFCGYTPEEHYADPALLLKLIHPDDQVRFFAALPSGESANESTVGFHGAAPFRWLRKDGGILWADQRVTIIRDAAGQTVAIEGIVRDVTARMEAEAALRESEAGLAQAQRLAHVGSWAYDLVSDTLTWSDETFRIAGYAPQAFTPTHDRLLAVIHPDDRPAILRGLAESLAGDPPDGLDHRIVRPDGEVRMVHQRAEMLRDAAGRPVKQVGMMQDITEWRALEERLRHQATHDALTGLPNRALCFERVDQALARAAREARPCAFLFLDLDRFKEINDTRGHDIGDQLLVAVAARLRAVIGDTDTLARLGGDEFTVLLESVDGADDATGLAERLAATLVTPLILGGREERVTASIGVVLSAPEHERPEDVLRDADVAMYRAKEAGRAGYALFDPAMKAALLERRALEADLWVALQTGGFVLQYQPVVALDSGDVVEVEALVRWPHPERGLIPPDKFIPLAEACGAIRPLGRWVLKEACRQGRVWLDAHTEARSLMIAVNLSAREFQDPELVATVAATLAETGFPAQQLRLEITEGTAMGDAITALRVLGALKALGVRLALDDFGTGYSSLAYLRQFPVDTLKIDRAFIRDLTTDARSGEICRAISTLAKTLNLEVTAEGIETALESAMVRGFGCDHAQGYYFARPLTPAQIDALWASGLTFNRPGAPAPTCDTSTDTAPQNARERMH